MPNGILNSAEQLAAKEVELKNEEVRLARAQADNAERLGGLLPGIAEDVGEIRACLTRLLELIEDRRDAGFVPKT